MARFVSSTTTFCVCSRIVGTRDAVASKSAELCRETGNPDFDSGSSQDMVFVFVLAQQASPADQTFFFRSFAPGVSVRRRAAIRKMLDQHFGENTDFSR